MKIEWIIAGTTMGKVPFRPEYCECEDCMEFLLDVWEHMTFGGVRVTR